MNKQGMPAMALLVGGKSTRTGTSKAWLTKDGMPIWRYIVGEMLPFGNVYLSLSSQEDDTPYLDWMKENEPELLDKIIIVHDDDAPKGPMGGIMALLHVIPNPAVFICACDMPFMNRKYIQYMCDLWEQAGEGAEGLMVHNGTGRIYATAGIYCKTISPRLDQRNVHGNFRLATLLQDSGVRFKEEEELPKDVAEALITINTMTDYRNKIGE